MSVFTWLIRKDLAVFFADRQGAALAVIVPVVLAAFFGMLFAPGEATKNVHLLVADQDHSVATRQLVEQLVESSTFEVEELDLAQAEGRVRHGDAPLLLVLPKGTGDGLSAGALFRSKDRRHVRLVYDPSEGVQADLAEGFLTKLVMEQATRGLANASDMKKTFADLQKGLDADASPELAKFLQQGEKLAQTNEQKGSAQSEGGLKPPIDFDREAAVVEGSVRGYNSFSQNFAGMLVMFLLFMAQTEAKRLHSEREAGSLLRLRLSRAAPWQILLASGAGTGIVALLASTAVYAAGMLAFGVRIEGSLPGFLLVVIAQAALVGGFSLLLAGLGRTEQQIAGIGSFVILLMSFAGGATVPSFVMPEWVRAASHVLPTYWATRGLTAMTWRGLGLDAALLPAGMLIAFAVVFAGIGVRRFRWS